MEEIFQRVREGQVVNKRKQKNVNRSKKKNKWNKEKWPKG